MDKNNWSCLVCDLKGNCLHKNCRDHEGERPNKYCPFSQKNYSSNSTSDVKKAAYKDAQKLSQTERWVFSDRDGQKIPGLCNVDGFSCVFNKNSGNTECWFKTKVSVPTAYEAGEKAGEEAAKKLNNRSVFQKLFGGST